MSLPVVLVMLVLVLVDCLFSTHGRRVPPLCLCTAKRFYEQFASFFVEKHETEVLALERINNNVQAEENEIAQVLFLSFVSSRFIGHKTLLTPRTRFFMWEGNANVIC